MSDKYLDQVESQLKLAHMSLAARLIAVERTPVGMSRRQSTLHHTRAMLAMIEEVQGLVHQDPENWDDKPELLPF